MLSVTIPGQEPLKLAYLVLDLNGTIQFNGQIFPGVKDLLDSLRGSFEDIYILSADTRGNLESLAADLGVNFHRLGCIKPEPVEKTEFIRSLGPERVVFLGNGNNDRLALKDARLGIVVIGSEGASSAAILAGDIVVKNPVDALNLLQDPQKLIATLRE